MARGFAALLLVLCACSSGCAYFRAVGKDATEVLELGLGVSAIPTLYVYAHAPVFGTALGYLPDSTYVGTDYGYTALWHMAGAGTIVGGELVRAQGGFSTEGWNEGRDVDLYAIQSQLLLLNISVVDHRTDISRIALQMTRLEAGAHVLVVGVTAGVDVVELVDLVAGVFGWDLLGDDDFVPPRAPFTPEQQGDAADPEGYARHEEEKAEREREDPEQREGRDQLIDPVSDP